MMGQPFWNWAPASWLALLTVGNPRRDGSVGRPRPSSEAVEVRWKIYLLVWTSENEKMRNAKMLGRKVYEVGDEMVRNAGYMTVSARLDQHTYNTVQKLRELGTLASDPE